MSRNESVLKEKRTDFRGILGNIFGTKNINDNIEPESFINDSDVISEEDKKLLGKTLKSIEIKEKNIFSFGRNVSKLGPKSREINKNETVKSKKNNKEKADEKGIERE